MDSSKRNIAIVCGGDSSEHDVSLRSAQPTGMYTLTAVQLQPLIRMISRLNSMENQSFLIMPTLQSMANLVRMV